MWTRIYSLLISRFSSPCSSLLFSKPRSHKRLFSRAFESARSLAACALEVAAQACEGALHRLCWLLLLRIQSEDDQKIGRVRGREMERRRLYSPLPGRRFGWFHVLHPRTMVKRGTYQLIQCYDPLPCIVRRFVFSPTLSGTEIGQKIAHSRHKSRRVIRALQSSLQKK